MLFVDVKGALLFKIASRIGAHRDQGRDTLNSPPSFCSLFFLWGSCRALLICYMQEPTLLAQKLIGYSL
jgi:hypothetical protein